MKLLDLSVIKNIKNKITKLSDTQKKFAIGILAFVVFDIAVLILLCALRGKSAVHLECYGSSEMSTLISLDSNAQKGFVNQNQYADFKFSRQQKMLFSKVYEDKSTVALTVRLQIMPAKNQKDLLSGDAPLNFRFGFLTNEDFTAKGKFINQQYPDNKRILIQGDLRNAPPVFDVSFAIQKSDSIENLIPEGFFVYSPVKCKIVAACIVPAEIGFDCKADIPFYGFACNGGVLDFQNHNFDFSGASMVFPVQNSGKNSMPEFVIGLYDNPEMKSTGERSIRGEINLGGEKLFVKNVVSAREVVIPAAAIKAPFARMELLDNKECISSFILRATHIAEKEVLTPVRTDPGLILKYKPSYWRTPDYEIFEWDRFPGILFFDTRNYDIQDNFFRRMAYFVEKQGYKGRLVSNEELEGKHGYNAHDYSAQSMADFFNKATETGFVLNKEELILKKILIKNRLLEEDGDFVKANEGGLVSISQESPDYLRTTLLAHEGWHTIFFRDEEFRNYVGAVFYTMDPTSRDFLIDYFKSQPGLGYDVNDEYLMNNEFMAYLMQQRLSDVAGYFVHLANRGTVIKFTPQLAAYVRKTEGKSFEDAAFALNDYVFDKYGIVCGNIALISK